jgi:hypothetical protein
MPSVQRSKQEVLRHMPENVQTSGTAGIDLAPALLGGRKYGG